MPWGFVLALLRATFRPRNLPCKRKIRRLPGFISHEHVHHLAQKLLIRAVAVWRLAMSSTHDVVPI
ncbi:hypothetical protein JXD38_12245 [candidate division WOR-3 bacterium]|nr:hypothetical protein [candidate division WOR-3 bacterium]